MNIESFGTKKVVGLLMAGVLVGSLLYPYTSLSYWSEFGWESPPSITKSAYALSANSIVHQTSATYLRAEAADSALHSPPFDLEAAGFSPGDLITISFSGGWRFICGDDSTARMAFQSEATHLIAVFSSTATLGPKSDLNRVLGAIDAGADYSTLATATNGQQTDIPQDFRILPNTGFEITIPSGAKYLFFSMSDTKFGDNCGEMFIAINAAFVYQTASTYLHTEGGDSAFDIAPMDLEAAGFSPGDLITISFSGGWRFICGNPADYRTSLQPEATHLIAVFSSTATLGPKSDLNRVPGAIDAGIDYETPRTSPNAQVTDIPQDFRILPNTGFQITIPAGAEYLFFSMADSKFGDNCGEMLITIEVDGDLSLVWTAPVQAPSEPDMLVKGKPAMMEVLVDSTFNTPKSVSIRVDSPDLPVPMILQVVIQPGENEGILDKAPIIPTHSTFSATVEIDPFNNIEESDELNNFRPLESPLPVKTTKALNIIFVPMKFNDEATGPSCDDIQKLAEDTLWYIEATYPTTRVTPTIACSEQIVIRTIHGEDRIPDAELDRLFMRLDTKSMRQGDENVVRVVGLVRQDGVSERFPIKAPGNAVFNGGATKIDDPDGRSTILDMALADDPTVAPALAQLLAHTFGWISPTSSLNADKDCSDPDHIELNQCYTTSFLRAPGWNVPLLISGTGDDSVIEDADNQDAYDFMNRPFEPDTSIWISRLTFDHLISRMKMGADPAVIGISGLIFRNGSGIIESVERFDDVLDLELGSSGQYTLEYLDSVNNDLGSVGFDRSFFIVGYGATQLDGFTLRIPDVSGATKIQLKDRGGNVLAEKGLLEDADPPVVTGIPDRSPDSGTWYNHSVSVTWAGDDGAGSGVAGCDEPTSYVGPDGPSVELVGSCSDIAGNIGEGSVTIDYDQTEPVITSIQTGGISDGGEFIFGSVPTDETSCDAEDLTSGVNSDGCMVSGYGDTIGTHIITAVAIDNAGNKVDQVVATYTVLPWTIKGFYAPVDMNDVVNTLKSGQSVPLKFEIFAGDSELTDATIGGTGTVIKSFTQKKINCNAFSGDPTDAIETTTTGSTSLKYDAQIGQFVGQWKTPSNSANTCWEVSVTTLDGTSITGYFKLTK